MKVKRQGSLQGKKGYQHLGHFGKASVLRAGHNTLWGAITSAVSSIADFNSKYAGAKGGQGLVANFLGANPNRGRQTTPANPIGEVKDAVTNIKNAYQDDEKDRRGTGTTLAGGGD